MKRMAIFASGNGSNFEALVNAYRDGKLQAEPVLCVTDKPGAGVVERSTRLGVPLLLLTPSHFASKREFELYILRYLEEYDVDFICLAGYMRLVGPTLLEAFPRSIINIHPSLLPAYKGRDAIRQAFDAGEKTFGVTVHFVDENLDSGEIIAQDSFTFDGDDFDALEAKVHQVEHKLFPEAINKVIKEL